MRKIKLLSICMALSACLISPITTFATAPDTPVETTEVATEQTSEEVSTETSEAVAPDENGVATDSTEVAPDSTEAATDTATSTDATTEVPDDSINVSQPSQMEESFDDSEMISYVDITFLGSIANLEEYQTACINANKTEATDVEIVLTITPQKEDATPFDVTLNAANGFQGFVMVEKDIDHTIEIKSKDDVVKDIDILQTFKISEKSELEFFITYEVPEVKQRANPFLSFLKNNIIFLILLLGASIGLFVTDYKKKNAL